ncbi:hypothetical protein N7G274_001893 [Stereocaulon virgatum]|uniref:Uncharacterized protein n=1 Tax=Stereocaulon virgatum TaxID=373712 RepID=A0ABR4ANP7_9LECA
METGAKGKRSSIEARTSKKVRFKLDEDESELDSASQPPHGIEPTPGIESLKERKLIPEVKPTLETISLRGNQASTRKKEPPAGQYKAKANSSTSTPSPANKLPMIQTTTSALKPNKPKPKPKPSPSNKSTRDPKTPHHRKTAPPNSPHPPPLSCPHLPYLLCSHSPTTHKTATDNPLGGYRRHNRHHSPQNNTAYSLESQSDRNGRKWVNWAIGALRQKGGGILLQPATARDPTYSGSHKLI